MVSSVSFGQITRPTPKIPTTSPSQWREEIFSPTIAAARKAVIKGCSPTISAETPPACHAPPPSRPAPDSRHATALRQSPHERHGSGRPGRPLIERNGHKQRAGNRKADTEKGERSTWPAESLATTNPVAHSTTNTAGAKAIQLGADFMIFPMPSFALACECYLENLHAYRLCLGP